jgi:hypothetical protein
MFAKSRLIYYNGTIISNVKLRMPIDWTKIYRNYKGLWVGLKADEKTVIASGRTVKEVVTKSRKKGFEHPLLLRIPKKVIPYVGSG